MSRRWTLLSCTLLLLVVVLAGCFGAAGPGDAPFDTGTPTPGWDGDPDNPWREHTLTVAIEKPANVTREFAPLVREALAYWEANAERYAGYPISYELEPNATTPDLVIEFVPTVESCGDEEHAAGCAPVLTQPAQVSRPERIRVRTGLSDVSTVEVLKHELGHTLGLDHEDAPHDVMRARSNLTTTPQPDATERAIPWGSSTLSVFLDLSDVPADERAAARAQVREALHYYEHGANGYIPENVSFVRTDNRSAADIVIELAQNGCGPNNVSCARLFWTDPDGDGEPEVYTRLEITIDSGALETDAVAWHVARWLGSGFAFESESEYPPPLRKDTGYHERRSEWWE